MTASEHATIRPAGPPQGPLGRFHDWLVSPAGRLLRYLLVLVIVIWAIAGSLAGLFRVCEQIVVRATDPTATTSCASPSLTDAGVLAVVLLILLLLWPDLTEFSAFGVSVKKLVQVVDSKVTKAGQRTRRIDKRTADTGANLRMLRAETAERSASLARQLENLGASVGDLSRHVTDAQYPTISPMSGWYEVDAERLKEVSLELGLNDEELDRRTRQVSGLARRLDLYDVRTLRDRSEWVVLIGLLISMYYRTDTRLRQNAPSQVEEFHDLETPLVQALIQLTQRMIAALIDGKRVDRQSAELAIALHWLLSGDDQY